MESADGPTDPTSQVPGLPAGWEVVRTSGPLGFVTHLTLARPDGSEAEWTSRRHRKQLGLGETDAGRTASGRHRPSAMSWWLGVLFGVGSVCFALGSLPVFFDSVDPAVLAWTFAVGSVFFTSAGYLQLHETVTAPEGLLAAPHRWRLRRAVRWRPHRIDWWAASVQLVGTVFFNVSTFAATQADLGFDREKHLVWAPDVAGSICFLVASWLAYAEVNRGVLPRSDRSVGWRIAALNLTGSIAFGASGVGARLLTTTGEPANVALVNFGTFLGAVCFLGGAALLPVESSRDSTVADAPSRS